MNYTEQTVTFACEQDTLAGILATPDVAASTGVIVIVGGPQYRAGSHRQFVLLSRALAAAGYPVLRFDYRGMGDSEGQQRDFLAVGADIAAAIDALQAHMPWVKRVGLWGLCDGASAALLYCHETHDPRVGGLCLLNPWVRSETGLAKTQVKYYYTQRLAQKEFWVKLLSGKVAASAASGLMRSLKTAFSAPASADGRKSGQSFQARMAQAWAQFKGPILLVLSGNDYTAKEFLEHTAAETAWAAALSHPRLARHDCPGADHTFSRDGDRDTVEALTIRWLLQCSQLLT